MSSHTYKKFSILIGGEAGAGIKTLEKLLSHAFRQSGFYLFSTKEYMSRVRGGSNTTLLMISDAPIQAPVWEVDIGITLDTLAYTHIQPRLHTQSIVIADANIEHKEASIVSIPMKERAKALGDRRYANSYVAGFVYGMMRLDARILQESIQLLFEAHAEGNTEAMLEGEALAGEFDFTLDLPRQQPKLTSKLHLLDGSTASGFGFLSGGCNFVTAYPMSPSTGVLTFMASMNDAFDIAVEQSEDEIASFNMVLGAWYGGARGLTTTSGGGFALMSEAISLSGMSETPGVIYLAQRPGPATGLPTRTEQGDLNLAIHSGHGDFPRVVLAAGDWHECVELGHHAMEIADRFQVPVIYLSDQYLADSIGMIETIDFMRLTSTVHAVETRQDYNRYTITDNGISPRGIPNVGEGIIVTTSDEHDERGQITESDQVREKMVAKRMRKRDEVIQNALPPKIYGTGEIAIVGWGSTKSAIHEALQQMDDTRLFQLHFVWVEPLNPEHVHILHECQATIVVENNATGQFADRLETHGVRVTHRIVQANGFPFFVDQLVQKLEIILKDIS